MSEAEQIKECGDVNKKHFKKMYEQKEYMEEYLKFKEVIAGMKKWTLCLHATDWELIRLAMD